MYHHHTQQQGFSNGSRSALHQPPPNQHPNPANMQPMRYQFPRPTQLPDELESALAIGTARDIDLRQMNPMNHHHQGAGAGTSQHGNYGSNQHSHSSDHLPGLQQNMQWSDYQAPDAPLGAMPPNVNVHSNQHLGLNERVNSNQTGVQVANMVAPVRDLNLSHPPRPQIGRQGQNFYTPESAGSILASFGLSSEDLEVLSHYPDDQLTPDTLPFILRDIQINKSGNQNPGSSTSSTLSRGIHNSPLPSSTFPPPPQSSEVPSLLTVTQTQGKVIDYGHASRANDEPKTGETFKREQLSGESTVKRYPVPSNSKEKNPAMHQTSLEPSQPRKIEDKDYRIGKPDKDYRSRTSMGKQDKDFRPLHKSHKPTKDYQPSSESRYKAYSKSSRPSSSSSKPQSEGREWPSLAMISDFTGIPPNVYPHTCSLCNVKCDQEKDWLQHVDTVVHTVSGKGLRNKYPDWRPTLPSPNVKYASHSPWVSKEKSTSRSVDKSRSRSPASSPPRSKYRVDTHSTRIQSRRHSPQSRHSSADRHSSSHGSKPLRTSSASRERRPASSELSDSHLRLKHGLWRDVKRVPDERNVSSSTDGSKHGHPQSHSKPLKGVTKPGAKTSNVSTKSPPAKKKKLAALVAKVSPVPECLVYLTGIPKDASEQEVTNLVGSFGKINNVILLPCSEEDNESDNGQKASVCMMKVEDAQALATATTLCIREQPITASVAKKPEAGKPPVADDGLPASGNDKKTPETNSGGEAEQKVHTEKGTLLLTGLPERGWCEDDIIGLVQPFWTPSDIIMATQIAKVLVPVPDKEAAAKMLEVTSSAPAKIQDSEIKLAILKQCIDCSSPVALFNVLMESADPQSTAAVSWNRLLVISNVPDTHSGYREVQKLIQRFGTVIKTLVIKNMVICEMATAAMALSVYKRFQTFPCIIQSNPLIFSRKADPKANTPTKMPSKGPDSSQKKTVKVKSSQPANEEKCKGQPQKLDNSQNKNKKMKISQKKVKEEDLKDGNGKNSKRLKMTIEGSSSVLLSDVSDTSDDLDAEDVAASVEEKTETLTIKVSEPWSVVGDSASKTSSSDQLPEVTQAITNAPVVEGVTETTSHSNSSDAPPAGDQVEVPPDTKTSTNSETSAVEETRPEGAEKGAKKLNAEKPESHTRKGKEEEREKERARRERERRAREREREERARRENERRERERRQRKRGYHEGSGSSSKSDSRQSSRRDKQDDNKSDTKTDQEDEFPFNLSDFVTVDEVGEVPDLFDSSTVPMETTVENADASTSIQQTTKEDTTMEATTTLVKLDEHESDVDHASTLTPETSDALVSSEVVNTAVSPQRESQTELNESQPQVSTCPETEDCEPTGEPDSAQAADVVSTPEDQPLPEPVASDEKTSTCSTAAGEDTAKIELDGKEINPLKTCDVTEQEEKGKETNPLKACDVTEQEEKGKETNPLKACDVTEQEEKGKETNPLKACDVTEQEEKGKETNLLKACDVTEQEGKGKETNPLKACDVTEQVEKGKETNPLKACDVTEQVEKGKETNPLKACDVTEQVEKGKETNPLKACDVTEQEGKGKETNLLKACEATEEEKIKAMQQKSLDEPNKNLKDANAEAGENQVCETPAPSTEVVCVKTQVLTEPSKRADLPPYDPKNPVGMEYLVPKTGFFCKVCNRFFSGAMEAQFNHCKTLKHHENLKEHLKKTGSMKSKTNSI